jgi:FMN hydrolase / 5-amino-6-(5-phospho-D-ribitylamino)uracil phosphatase
MRDSIVLFDVMGTLVHDPFYEEVPRFFGMTLQELIAVKHPTAWVEFERDEIDEATLEAKFFADGRSFDLEGLKQTMTSAYRPLPGVEALLDELAREGVQMHAFSNYPTWYRLIEDAVGLSRWLRWSFVSCHTGHRKPAAAAYRTVVQRLGRAADDLVFVDDREDNCEGARRAGMHAIRFRDASSLRALLVDLGVL